MEVSTVLGRIPGLEPTLVNAASRNFVVMASGNDQGNARRSAPGCTDGPSPGTRNLFTVAAVTCGKQCELYSNYGKPPVDFVAVGSDVLSTYLFDPVTRNWRFYVTSGTSISAGVISGVIHSTGSKPRPGGRVFCRALPRDVIDEYRFGRR